MPIKAIILTFFTLCVLSYAENPKVVSRSDWTFQENNTTQSGMPSNLKFLRYYDILPDEISIKVISKKDLTNFIGKKIFIGYGVVDPRGNNCKIFPPEVTGLDNNVTICLPWWRIERTYEKSLINITDVSNILCELPTPHPPIRVSVCKQWSNEGELNFPGGKVVCTSYYNRLESTDCWNNPKQGKCFVDNCSIYTKKHCKESSVQMGDVQNLPTAEKKGNAIMPTATKISVVSHQYICPAGSMIPHTKCLNKKSVMMYPYECVQDNPSTIKDESLYKYCDDKKPQYDNNGNIIGFLGRCPNGKQVMCDVDSFSQTTRICKKPINIDENDTSYKDIIDFRNYKEFTVDVLSGETDIYAAKPNCVRANTIGAARDRIIVAHIKGTGNLDDDIYVLRHRGDGSHFKVYCNMQHNEDRHSRKAYNGKVLQCIDNDGSYSFNKSVEIDATDIVTIQEATEDENNGATPFSMGRTHYRSTKVEIDGVVAAPDTFIANYPYYPVGQTNYLKTWENTLGTLSIMFPYAGAYQIFFFDKSGKLMSKRDLTTDDFEAMGSSSYKQLNLAKDMEYSSSFNPKASNSCLKDDWAEWGGGVYGGRASKTGASCQSPNNSYVKAHAITKIIVKDLLTGNITPIPLVYPLPYPNRIFISKLKLYELRKYRCYDNFSEDVLP